MENLTIAQALQLDKLGIHGQINASANLHRVRVIERCGHGRNSMPESRVLEVILRITWISGPLQPNKLRKYPP